MSCSATALSLLLLAPCNDGGGDDFDVPMTKPVQAALASEDRTESDRKRDELRRPDAVLSFFEIKPGMTVLDLFSGGGYYTEILSRVVGNDGEVVAHNNEPYLNYARKDLAGRYDNDRLPNVKRITAEADELELPDAEFDAALVMSTWHDFYFEEPGWPAVDEKRLVSELCSALKPGAVLGITDHIAKSGSDPEKSGHELHRIDPAVIRAELEAGCFNFEGEIKVLRNPADDHSLSAMNEKVRGKTDRVVYKFRRS